MKIKSLFLFCLLATSSLVMAQEAPENWFNLDPGKDKITGVSTEQTYKTLLKGRKSETVVVAVIDSGVDYKHEDLKDIMWVNPGEIAGNGIDDDKNGYIDDVHGWNFIGGKDGRNIEEDALEITRLYAKYSKQFKDVNPDKLKKKEKKQYEEYMGIKKDLDKKNMELNEQAASWFALEGAIATLTKGMGGNSNFTKEDLEKHEPNSEDGNTSKTMILKILERGASMNDIREQVKGATGYFDTQLNKWYNPDFDPRAEIVGDNYADSSERYYGNNDVKGPDAGHGTHVAGIIAAVRDNDLGMKGVADNVRIMSIRAVPDGDERDKDVANAIFYAVNNGATIINMSFGKGYSHDKAIVDKAVRYAEKHDVLLVHAAGNDAKNTDSVDNKNFPTDIYGKKKWFRPKEARGWMEIGALSYKGGEDAVASFSNYGKDKVDIFAPGYQIYSTTPEQEYAAYSGTSMAAPVTAGVAAVLRSYFPSLSAKQIKNIIMETAVPQTQKVKQPGTKELVSFSELCKTGGVANVYNAVNKAKNTKGKRKMRRVIKKPLKETVRP
ncbi:MAG: S8 family peptidase [Saprospiraceae bacterium]